MLSNKALNLPALEKSSRVVVTGLASLLGVACASPDPDQGWPEGEVGDTAEPLLGAATAHASCVQAGRDDELATLARYARIISRSTAFSECARELIDWGIDLPASSTQRHGPYIACGTGDEETDDGHLCTSECPTPPAGSDCKCDPMVGATPSANLAQQRARLLSAIISRRPILQTCVASLPEGPGKASASFTLNGGVETWEWKNLSNDVAVPFDRIYLGALAWHEGLHQSGYLHGDTAADDPNGDNAEEQPDNCGFGYDDTEEYSVYKSGLAVAACIHEVGDRSESASYGNCDLESSLCESNELRIIRSFDSGAGDCECVPDAFEWPNDANEAGDMYGDSIATGDFDDDGDDDLAVGAPGEDSGAGAVYLYRGSTRGLQAWKRITQSDLTVDDAALGSSVNLGHEAGDRFGAALASGDFNDDGYDDLAIGLPGEALGYASCSTGSCGYAVVLPGTATGLEFRKNSTNPNPTGLTQASLGANESGDRFGWSLAAGDLNGDGRADLAVGTPYEQLGTAISGVVMLFSGQASQSRLVVPWTYLSQATGGWTDETDDEFGAAVAIGNLYGSDAREELAIGAPGERWNQQNDEGWVFVAEYNGTSWSMPQATANLNDSGISRFGSALAIGDVVNNSTEDLVVGAPGQSNGAGGVLVFRGQQTTMTYTQFLHNGDAVAGDRFGASLAIGDIRTGSKQDLAVGIPGEAIDTPDDEGAVWVYTGSTTTLTSALYKGQGEFFSASATDVVLPTEQRDPEFGTALAVGNFNGSGGDELVVGGPFDDPAQNGVQSGAVFLMRSHTIADAQKIDQITTRFGDDHM